MFELTRGRSFKIWEYHVSHSRLLVRSPASGDHSTNVDITFAGVSFYRGPTGPGTVVVEEIGLAEAIEGGYETRARHNERFWALKGTDATVIVAAAYANVVENCRGLMTSSLDWSSEAVDAPIAMPLEMTIDTNDPGDREALLGALSVLAFEPYLVTFRCDPPTDRIVIGGTSESHLDVALWWLSHERHLPVRAGEPRIVYLETACRRVVTVFAHAEAAGRIQLELAVEPLIEAAGSSFASRCMVPDQYQRALANGVWSALAEGDVAGHRVVDVAVVLMSGDWGDPCLSASSVEATARATTRQALLQSLPVVLEPIMRVKVTMPDQYLDVVREDFARRRGRDLLTSWDGDWVTLSGSAPLAALIGYAADLKGLTDNRQYHLISFKQYFPIR